MAIFSLNHSLTTSVQWRERIEQLKAEAAGAEGELEAPKRARKEADAQGVLTGKSANGLAKLEETESRALRKRESLIAAIEMAGQQLHQALAAEEAERQEKLRKRRAELRGQIVARAGRVDQLFAAAASELTALDGLLGESFRAGRGVPHRVKTYATRAMIACGLHPYFDPSGGWSARELLSTQLDRLLAEPPQPAEKSA